MYRYYFDTIINAKVKTNKTEEGLEYRDKEREFPTNSNKGCDTREQCPLVTRNSVEPAEKSSQSKGTASRQKRGCCPGTSTPL